MVRYHDATTQRRNDTPAHSPPGHLVVLCREKSRRSAPKSCLPLAARARSGVARRRLGTPTGEVPRADLQESPRVLACRNAKKNLSKSHRVEIERWGTWQRTPPACVQGGSRGRKCQRPQVRRHISVRKMRHEDAAAQRPLPA